MLGRDQYSGYNDDSRSAFMEDNRHYSSSSSSSSSSSFSAACSRSNKLFWPVVALSFLTLLFFILTIAGFSRSTSAPPSLDGGVYSPIIGAPFALPASSSGAPLTFTILQMNDVYELLPMAKGTRGGLARVAYIRSVLRSLDPATLTVCAGDLLSPSALSLAVVNGSALAGRQMVSTLNAMGVDYMVYGNHEFDLTQAQLQARLGEAHFTWLSLNTFDANTNLLFPGSGANAGVNAGYALRVVNGVRVLLLGLTIDSTTGGYVNISGVDASIALAKALVASKAGQYDVAIALTHWDLSSDTALVERVPQIGFVMGGHEHANYQITRGVGFTPILKSDSNDATVYAHFLAYYPSTRQLVTQSNLLRVDADIPELPAVAAVANQWWADGIAALRAQGFDPDAVVVVLPDDVEWDGRSEEVRSNPSNALTQTICNSLLFNASSNSTIGGAGTVALFNTGSVRVDDILEGELTQYDILRILPFPNTVQPVVVSGDTLRAVLTTATGTYANVPGTGGFLSTCGGLALQPAGGGGSGMVWGVNGQALSDTALYTVWTSNFMVSNTGLMSGQAGAQGMLMSLQLIAYLTGPTYVPQQ